MGSDMTTLPGVVDFSDPTQLAAKVAEAEEQGGNVRYLARDPYDLDQWDPLYDGILSLPGNAYVWCDEAGVVFPSSGTPKRARGCVIHLRKYGKGHLACHTRPVEIDRNLRAQSRWWAVFFTPHEADQDTLAAGLGCRNRAEFAGYMAELQTTVSPDGVPHGFLWCQTDRFPPTIIISPPLEGDL